MVSREAMSLFLDLSDPSNEFDLPDWRKMQESRRAITEEEVHQVQES